MKHSCLVIDDEELARELLTTHLAKLPEFELIGQCASALEARGVLQANNVDLLFLDIEMPVLKGIDFLKSLHNPPHVIFTTAYRNYAVEGFDLNAVDYLLKPITFERFFRAADKYLRQNAKQSTTTQVAAPSLQKDTIFIRKNRKQVKLELAKIKYIESLKDYVQIVTQEERHVVKHSLTSLLDLLDKRFMRIHRSFVVNIDKITAYTKQDVEIGSKELPIGELYRAMVESRLKG